MKLPTGNTKEAIKQREKFILKFYSDWKKEHPDKKMWNNSLRDYIHVRFLSINETANKASRTSESTIAVSYLTEILRNAKKVKETKPKANNQNQKRFKKVLIMEYKINDFLTAKMTVGVISSGLKVQYCITGIKTTNGK